MRLNTPSKTPRDDSSAEVFVEVIIKTVAILIMISFNLLDRNILEECDGSIFRVEVSRVGM
jgi:hypothetical protein